MFGWFTRRAKRPARKSTTRSSRSSRSSRTKRPALNNYFIDPFTGRRSNTPVYFDPVTRRRQSAPRPRARPGNTNYLIWAERATPANLRRSEAIRQELLRKQQQNMNRRYAKVARNLEFVEQHKAMMRRAGYGHLYR